MSEDVTRILVCPKCGHVIHQMKDSERRDEPWPWIEREIDQAWEEHRCRWWGRMRWAISQKPEWTE